MAELTAIFDETVRRERGRIVGGLLRLCGSLDAAEEAFQDAALAALEAWRDEPPANPGAWLMTAAKNRAKDAHRHRAVEAAKAPLLVDEVVRRERGRILGGLLRLGGSVDAAEEAFQEAALAAVEAWSREAPANPGA